MAGNKEHDHSSQPEWVNGIAAYGRDHPQLSAYIKSIEARPLYVEIVEMRPQGQVENGIRAGTRRQVFSDAEMLRKYLISPVDECQKVLAISVKKLSGALIQLLGARFDMDYETWTHRFYPSDREYFAGPLRHKGPMLYSHFNLACVDFFSATSRTPEKFLKNQKLERNVRFMKFQGLNGERWRSRVFVIRRVSGHLRLERHCWVFVYFGDDFGDFETTHFIREVPANAMIDLPDWLCEVISSQPTQEHIDRLGEDGFGLTVKILRDIKSSWKLLLGEMEEFLED